MAIGIGGGRVARLGIPRVNPNPRPPNGGTAAPMRAALGARLAKPKIGLGPGHPARPPRPIGIGPAKPVGPSPATTPAARGNAAAPAAPTPQSAPVDPFKQAAESQGSSNPFQVPSYTPQAGEADPRDAAYWTNLSKLMFNDQQAYSQDLREQTEADTAYNSALQQAIQNRSVQERQLGENALKAGLTASGWHDRTEAEQTRSYTQERANAALTKEQQDQARLAAREALVQGFGIDAAAELAAAAGRYGERQREEAAKGPGEPSAPSAPAKPAGAGKGGGKGGGGKGKGKGGGKGPGNGGTTAPRSAGPSHNPYKAALAKARKAR